MDIIQQKKTWRDCMYIWYDMLKIDAHNNESINRGFETVQLHIGLSPLSDPIQLQINISHRFISSHVFFRTNLAKCVSCPGKTEKTLVMIQIVECVRMLWIDVVRVTPYYSWMLWWVVTRLSTPSPLWTTCAALKTPPPQMQLSDLSIASHQKHLAAPEGGGSPQRSLAFCVCGKWIQHDTTRPCGND